MTQHHSLNKSAALENQNPIQRRRSSLRSFGTTNNPFPTTRNESSQSSATSSVALTRRVSLRSSNLRNEVLDITESQSPRRNKRKASSSLPQSPRKRRTLLPPPPSGAQRAAAPSPHPEVLRRRSTLRSFTSSTPIPYVPRPYPPGVILPAGIVHPIPAVPPPPKRPLPPKHICRRGNPRCGLDFPSRLKLQAHQRAEHGDIPLGWLATEIAKEVSKGTKLTVEKTADGRTRIVRNNGRDTLVCQVCHDRVASTKRLEEHLQKVHGIHEVDQPESGEADETVETDVEDEAEDT
ncbi:hypothetical protein HYFRA_00003860 [Hymenoscyphus fraxineus]|uniref:C2H2-type domain-containing protein n=1 Tax=Hymenoscyphus fraxineus TaxID=746836 RepID=A0A9N9KZ16_9HELO|nr:hypothetical protein HYFRA_00003860 [Hymenoscyphus fraxineus]